VHYDDRNEKLGYKIREAQLQQVPYMLIIGDKELEQKTVSVRLRTGDMLNFISMDEFKKYVTEEYKTKSLVSLLEAHKATDATKEKSH
jgi:threonyl-tRNA synthetase